MEFLSDKLLEQRCVNHSKIKISPIPTINGALALRRGRYVDIQVTNDSFENLQLNSINFDYSRMFGGAPKNVTVEYLSGDLDDAAVSLFQASDLPTNGVYVDYDDYSVDLAATLSDTTLAAGESATFRISVSNASKGTTSGGLDNISIAAEEVTDEADPEFLFIEHDGISSATDFTRDGISVTLQSSARIRTAGSTDGSTGDVDVPEVIPTEVDGVHAVRPNGGQFEFTIANTNLNEIALSTIRFDYNRRFSGNPPTLEVEYAGGDLGTDSVLLARFEDVPASSFVSGDFEDFAVDVRSALSDYSLAQGESATFRISVSDGVSTRAGSLDNISMDGVVPVIVDPNDLDGDGIPNDWELTHGLDPNDPSDALADPDGDLFSNLDEYLMGYDPHQFNGGDIAIEAGEPDAYEKDIDSPKSASFTITRAAGIAQLDISITPDGGDNANEAATTGDYEVVYHLNGTEVIANGHVTIAEGASSVDVLIRPIQDDQIEYPENWRVTLNSSDNYHLAGNTSESGKLFEATDRADNDRVYSGPFIESPNTVGNITAVGQAFITMNGSNRIGKVTVEFGVENLTSTQLASHIHMSNLVDPNGSQGPHIFDIPFGNFEDHLWDVRPTNGFTGQDIIDALNDQNEHFLYLNIHTANNPEGEIRAKFNHIVRWTPPSPAPEIPLLTGDDLTRDVARFLTQATFGPTRETIDALVDSVVNDHNGDQIAAYSEWIDNQFALDMTRHRDYAFAANLQHWRQIDMNGPGGYSNSVNRNKYHPRRIHHEAVWWTTAAAAHDQLRQRVGFALSEIFVISRQDERVHVHVHGATRYEDALIENAFGNYRELIEYISKSPMMGIYLSHLQNTREKRNDAGEITISPDENYAREIMQLFSIGLQRLNPDGSVALINDRPEATYTNDDITELARVFTGWSFSKRASNKSNDWELRNNNKFDYHSNRHRYISPEWEYPMKGYPDEHDFGSKALLGATIPADLSVEDDMGAALDILYNHPNLGPFIAHLMIQRMTHSNPSPGYIYRVAQAFENGTYNGQGSGVRGDFGAMVRAILLDYEARSLVEANKTTYGKQKEPLLRATQAIRALGAKSELPIAALTEFGYPADQLDNFPDGTTRYNVRALTGDQNPLDAPSVFNWFLPKHEPGGTITANGLFAPEMVITNEFQVVASNNDLYRLVFEGSGLPGYRLPLGTASEAAIKVDYAALNAIHDSGGSDPVAAATTLVDHLDEILTSGRLKLLYEDAAGANPRDIIINTVANASGSRKARTAAYLIVSSPEYTHQK